MKRYDYSRQQTSTPKTTILSLSATPLPWEIRTCNVNWSVVGHLNIQVSGSERKQTTQVIFLFLCSLTLLIITVMSVCQMNKGYGLLKTPWNFFQELSLAKCAY